MLIVVVSSVYLLCMFLFTPEVPVEISYCTHEGNAKEPPLRLSKHVFFLFAVFVCYCFLFLTYCFKAQEI